jgi:hypothetical protein
MRGENGVCDPEFFVAHKFRAPNNYLWQSLESCSFHFASPDALNDPADCQIDLSKAFRLARVGLAKEHSDAAERLFLRYAEEVRERARTTGVFSLSCGDICGEEERLLWAHYAANHSGVCLTFQIPYTFVVERLVGSAPVTYSSDKLFDSMRALDLTRRPDFDRDLKSIVTAFLTTKAPEWKYECESRLLSFDAGSVTFERTWLRQICFGLRTSNADKQRIAQLARGYPNTHLTEVFQVDDDIFRLGIREVGASVEPS